MYTRLYLAKKGDWYFMAEGEEEERDPAAGCLASASSIQFLNVS